MTNFDTLIRKVSGGIHAAANYLGADLECICDGTMASHAKSALEEVQGSLDALKELDAALAHHSLFVDALSDISMHFGWHQVEFDDSRQRSILMRGYAEEFVKRYGGSDWTVVDYHILVGEFAVEKMVEYRKSRPAAVNAQDKPFRVRYVLGTEAVREYEDAVDCGEKWNESSLCDCGSVVTGEFHTQAELDAYNQGIEDAVGWLDAAQMMTDSEWESYLKDNFSDDDDD